MTAPILPPYGSLAWKKLVVKASGKSPAKRTAAEKAALAIEYEKDKGAR